MPYYEVLCLAHGGLTRRELGELATRTARVFFSQGATVTRLQGVGANGNGPRRLAYTIRRAQTNYTTGYYLNFCAFASPAALKEVCRRLSLDEAVLRSLPIRKHVSEAVLPAPDVERGLPSIGVDKNDPSYELHKFLSDYERDFPDGQTYVASEELDMEQRLGNDDAVQAVISNLKATTAASVGGNSTGHGPGQQRSDPGLRWLLDLSDEPKRKP